MQFPTIIVNLKAYSQGIGEKSLQVSRDIAKAGKERDVGVGVSPQYADLYRISNQVEIPIFAQHVDSLDPGRGTGYLLPEAARMAGAVGSLINHSERQLEMEEIEKRVERLDEANMTSIVCAENPEIAEKVTEFSPDVIAVEPPELIGGDNSVSQTKPDVIEETVNKVQSVDSKIHVLCGAGVSTGEDVKIALELGAEGILIASAVVKADDPKEVMLNLAEGAIEAGK